MSKVVYAALGVFLAFALVMLFVTGHAEIQESARCGAKGGVYVERTCIDSDAVIEHKGEA